MTIITILPVVLIHLIINGDDTVVSKRNEIVILPPSGVQANRNSIEAGETLMFQTLPLNLPNSQKHQSKIRHFPKNGIAHFR